MSVKEFSTGSCLAIRASAASVASSAESLRSVTACAICWADSPSVLMVMARSGRIDTGRLGFVRQREFVDQPRQPQRHFEVRPHGRPPGFLDRQGQRLCDGVDVIIKMIGSHFAPILVSSEPATADAG